MSQNHLDSTLFENKNVLITGATGYIGSSLTTALSSINCNLFLQSRNITVPKALTKTKATIHQINADITEKDFWTSNLKNVDILFHLAAQTSSQMANSEPLHDLEINVLPILRLIDACTKRNYSPDIIFSGAVTQVGYTNGGKVNESYRDLPVTMYDIHKLASEKYLQYYSNQLNKRSTTLRLCNIFGPGPASSKSDRGIINQMIVKALKGEPLTIFGDGSYVRDYLYITDVVEAFLNAAISIDKTKGNYYVLGSGIGTSLAQIAKLIAKEVEKQTGKKTNITYVPFPPNTSQIEYRNFTADSSLFKNDTGWVARTTLRAGIQKTVEYFLNQYK